jgi:hypothetical protein
MPIAVSAGEERAGIDLRLQPAVTVRVAGSLVATESVLATVPVLLRPAGSDDPSLEADWPAAISDADGRFTFPAVPAGDYTLRAATSRQPLYWGESPIVVGREDIDGIALNLQPGFRISGRVIFEGHTPAPPPSALKELSIVVEPAAGTWTLSERTSTIRVDTTGQFTTAGLPRGRYFLRLSDSPVGWMFKSAMHGGRDLSDVAVELLAGDVTGVGLTFTDRWTSFSGLVLPSQGVPTGMAIDATVLLFPVDPQFWNDPASNPRRIRSTGTGKNGEFTFASVPPGEYYAVAVTDESANDWQDAGFMQTLTRFATRVTIDEGEHKKLDLRMRDAR